MYAWIGSKGAKALAMVLENNSTITEIDLSYNNIGFAGAKALTTAMEKNSTIRYIDLCNNNGLEWQPNLATDLKKRRIKVNFIL
ncbi:hypothetical protein [Candidatus Cardinium hertigii]|jgi:Ran GTPase-activating protein (RanGAP) involved in mRNA processing and transport|uniref:Uncharacterized protein n=1 Tax=Candidatus Cardinium hertigii TaxID=247481 RepID=A0A3N2QC15_9BACT|nr:hypothetical protein [Candidatus Cardinium hertigii]ROT47291.1 hypothetical protein EDM02_04055 [Candidatus Cardinium hertigii]ROT47497.1 hypothetical protein EDM02_02485 [Candidatus Cardinium hertigii]